MTHDLTIQSMQAEDLHFAEACTAAEEWVSETLPTFETFFRYHPAGCLIARIHAEPAGICIATPYGTSGFIGELIVRAEMRGRGIGSALLKSAVAHLQGQGVETIYLDGVIPAVPLYQRNGFRKICRSWRFFGTILPGAIDGVRAMSPQDLPAVFALDRAAFGADRSFFIARRQALFPDLCKVLVEGGALMGYIQGRRGEDWVSAGPWVVQAEAQAPINLLYSIVAEAPGLPGSLGVLDTNPEAVLAMRALGLVELDDSPWRMALGPATGLGATPGCLAVGSAAKG